MDASTKVMRSGPNPAELLSRSGLAQKTVTAWLKAQPQLSKNFPRDAASCGKFWRLGVGAFDVAEGAQDHVPAIVDEGVLQDMARAVEAEGADRKVEAVVLRPLTVGLPGPVRLIGASLGDELEARRGRTLACQSGCY